MTETRGTGAHDPVPSLVWTIRNAAIKLFKVLVIAVLGSTIRFALVSSFSVFKRQSVGGLTITGFDRQSRGTCFLEIIVESLWKGGYQFGAV